MTIPADQASITGEGTCRQLELTIHGRTLRVSATHFFTRASDEVDCIDLVAEEADSTTTLAILMERAASSLTSDESARSRPLHSGPWGDYAGVQRFGGDCGFQIQGIDSDRESVQLVIGTSEANLRLLLWHGLWREQRPSIEEYILRDESASIAFR